MSPQRKRLPKGVVDTSVVIAGAAAFRGAPLQPKTESGKFLLKWINAGHFTWLYTEDILDEYKQVMRRCGVRQAVIGKFINLLREEAVKVAVRKTVAISPDPKDDPFCVCAERGDADFIVTLNPKDFPQAKVKARIVHPRDSLPARSR